MLISVVGPVSLVGQHTHTHVYIYIYILGLVTINFILIVNFRKIND